MTTVHTLSIAEADLVYDVRGPLPAPDGRPPLFMIGQPMTASGFETLASYFPDRGTRDNRRRSPACCAPSSTRTISAGPAWGPA